MPQFDRFLIAPFNTGLQKNLRPWLILDDAFEELQNAYVFRGRVRKRFGSNLMGTTQLLSRLRVSLGNNTGAAMNLPANTASHTPQLAIGQIFSLGSTIFTVYQLGAGVATLTTNGAITAVIDSVATPNTITVTGGAAVPLFWYPSLPVMGITQYESGAVNNHPSYAFDTEFAYVFTPGTGWARSGTAVWKGNNSQFFWAFNWQGTAASAASAPVMFVTNFNFTLGAGVPAATDDPIWYFDGTNWVAMLGSGANGIFFLPGNGGTRTQTPFVQTARIIVAFKNRTLLLNTVENNNSSTTGTGTATQYPNRCRYSMFGSPLAVNAWYEPNNFDAAGNVSQGAYFIDAATEEQIVSAEFIKDRLIVYFERSTWEIAYTGNETRPFIWQKLNTELGSQSTFSSVPFDKEVLTIGQSGFHACNGSNVVRIDDIIPDEIFTFSNQNNNYLRTAGIRDYFTECVYYTFVSNWATSTQTFPNQIMLYNYRNQTFAFNDDCFTAFGYFEQQVSYTWANSAPITWAQANFPWNSGIISSNQRRILAGTPEGFVVILNSDESRNAPAISITNLSIAASGIITVTAINHNLSDAPTLFPYDADYVLFENVVGSAGVMTYLNGTILPVAEVKTADTFTVNTFGGLTTGSYLGGGTLSRVSNIQIKTKRFNPYDKIDTNVTVQRIDFGVQKTEAGAISVDYYASSSESSMVEGAVSTGSNLGTYILETSPYDPVFYPLELTQKLLWHPIYFQSSGESIQIELYLAPEQMTNPNMSLSDFQLEGMVLYTAQCSSRLQ